MSDRFPDKFFKENEILHLFKFIDSNNNMTIDKQELEQALKKFGVEKSYFDGIFSKIDDDKKNVIDYEHFKKYVIEQEIILLNLYNKLDKNEDGKFTLEDLKKVCTEYYPYRNYDENFFKNLINNIDINHNGIVEFEEFRDILLFLPNKNMEFLLNWGQSSVLMNELNDAFPIQFIAEIKKPHEKEANLYYRFLVNFLAGGISAALSRTLTAPLDRLKILYQVNYSGAAKPPSIIKGLREIFLKDGFKGYFRGNLVNCLKASPDTSIKFACFELLKQLYINDEEKNSFIKKNYENDEVRKFQKENSNNIKKLHKKITPLHLFFFGSISGLVSAFSIYPLHVVRIRLSAAPTGTYSGIIDAVKKISQTEGKVKPFFSGLQASSYLIIMSSGLNFMSYDIMRDFYFYFYNKKDIPVTYLMTIGALSATLTNIVCYPFQLISTKMIMQGLKCENKTTFILTKEVYKLEGFRGFYKGFTPLMNKLLIGSAISFSVYEKIKQFILLDQ